MAEWRNRTGVVFECERSPARGSRGMVVSNHPLASSAGAEMLAAGGNAIDAAIATLFTLTVVEPMMVGIIGGGMAHIRLADGSHRFIDGQSTVPKAVKPDTYRSKPGSASHVFDTIDDENLTGPKSVAVYEEHVKGCATLVWNGPLGAFEMKPFDDGTVALAKTVADLTTQGTLLSVAGGGDTVAALAAAGVEDKFSYVSTAGGAFLEWMEGKTLPGVAALIRAA